MDKKGSMQNAYSPFLNFINTQKQLSDFRTENLKFDRYTPVDILVTDEYDGSSNIIINDDKNKPRLINSRFSQLENNTFNIPVHSGNAVTNIYEDSTFDKDTQLLKLYDHIPSLKFEGIFDGGGFKCGSYVFYFKLADADGNLTNLVQESGIVQVHVGTPNTKKIRMGMLDELAGKLIKFTLSGIDAGFDYVRIFYERSSTDDSQALIKSYFMIDKNYPISNNTCQILLTGEENIMLISKSDILTEFADILTAKTLDIVDNTLFLGNIQAYELDYPALQQIAWRIVPSVVTEENIGSIDQTNYSLNDGGAYYNVENVYNNTGYWNEEFYRFGVVFIYTNNLCSPVFNILGFDLTKFESHKPDTADIFNTDGDKRKQEPEDFFFNKTTLANSKGVVKLPSGKPFKVFDGLMQPTVTKIKFDWSNIIYKRDPKRYEDNIEDGIDERSKSRYYDLFRLHNIKGFFFVRQKRIPTIISQGIVVGLTGKEFGAIPVLLDSYKEYCTKSFLHENRLLYPTGATVKVNPKNVETKALLVPDYDVNEPTLNLIFTGLEFQLLILGNGFHSLLGENKHYIRYFDDVDFTKRPKLEGAIVNDVKLTAVPKNSKIKTDGKNYFSSLAGSPDEAYKTADVNHEWDKTPPQDLTASTSLIRGIWGNYVGMSSDACEYGDIVNIRPGSFKDDSQTILEFEKRFKDFSPFFAISYRTNTSDYYSDAIKPEMVCAKGDCFLSVFTHRMMSNFIDTELPTNKKIIDPACWASNYGVRCTALILKLTHSNLTSDSDGWYVPAPSNKKSSIVSMIFGILTGNIGIVKNAAEELKSANEDPDTQDLYANEIVHAFEVYTGRSSKSDKKTEYGTDIGKYDSDESVRSAILTDGDKQENGYINKQLYFASRGWIKKVNPQEQESQGGLNLKSIFKADDKWELHGLASINRADVNAVSFGQWITFPICSSYNLALRDVDFTNATEEARMNKKRAFYPYEEMNPEDHLMESGMINAAAKVSLSDYNHPVYTTIPFIRQEFFNRIYWSKPNVAEKFINSYRMIYNTQYREYNKEFGAITKLVAMPNSLLVVFQHGIGLLPVNRSPQSELEASPYLPHKSVLPSLVLTIPGALDYGSMWKDSVLRTPMGFVYGVDTVAKKIWRTNGREIDFISDHKISKFLNDHIDLSEFDYKEYIGHINVKTHYNEFKHDVIFTYYKDTPILIYDRDEEGNILKEKDVKVPLKEPIIVTRSNPAKWIDSWNPGTTWSICYNEVSGLWTTLYDWYPVESCNVDNIFFSFDKDAIDDVYDHKEDIPTIIPCGYTKNDTKEFIEYSHYKVNKVFLDKAFTHNTDVYIGGTISCLIENPSGKYISFYCKPKDSDQELITVTGATMLNTYPKHFGADPKWEFRVYQIESNSVTINTSYYLAEVKQHFNKPSDQTDPVLQDWNFRCSEANLLYLWKHGMAGLYDNQGKIKPTNWYGKQHEWGYEFIVNEDAGVQKIFNNLLIISNKVAPYKFEYEVIGEGYDWYIYKEVIRWINKNVGVLKQKVLVQGIYKEVELTFDGIYKLVLSSTYDELRKNYPDFPKLFGFEGKTIKKIPYLKLKLTDKKDDLYYKIADESYWYKKDALKDKYDYHINTSETCLIEDELLNEDKVHTESLGLDIKKYGRLRGNMEYLEDNWKVEIRPISFRYAYLDSGEMKLTTRKYETRHRDKFLRIRVRYDGKDLAVVLGVATLFDYSFA